MSQSFVILDYDSEEEVWVCVSGKGWSAELYFLTGKDWEVRMALEEAPLMDPYCDTIYQSGATLLRPSQQGQQRALTYLLLPPALVPVSGCV